MGDVVLRALYMRHLSSVRMFAAVVFASLCTVSLMAAPCTLSTTNPSVTICTPANGATVTSPVHVVAGTTSSYPVTAIWVYVDNVAKDRVVNDHVDTLLDISAGKHTILV